MLTEPVDLRSECPECGQLKYLLHVLGGQACEHCTGLCRGCLPPASNAHLSGDELHEFRARNAKVLLRDSGDVYCRDCWGKRVEARKSLTAAEVLRRWPYIVAHVICESLGYATPMRAAHILLDAIQGKPNWCEWIACCHAGKPMGPVITAIKTRHYHKGYMAEIKVAIRLVRAVIQQGEPPEMLASWF